MAYVCELGTGQTLYLDNQENQTIITTHSSSSGQQQQSSNSFTTGKWTSTPQVFRTQSGIVIKIMSSEGEHFLQVQGSSIGIINDSSPVNHSQQLQLEQVKSAPTSSMPPMEPMKPMESMKSIEPMKPMNMGDMSMSMNPMEMRMGNMEMKMGGNAANVSTKQYCSQCGAKIKPDDRFCSSCGHRLS